MDGLRGGLAGHGLHRGLRNGNRQIPSGPVQPASLGGQESGFGYDDILYRLFGLQGTVDTHYFGQVSVKTQETRSVADVGNLYTDGAAANIATFHQSITNGDYSNPTVAESVRSNLTTILGRTAAYRQDTVTWDQMMRKREKLAADLKGLKET